MANDIETTQVLDFLFDQSDGILRDEKPTVQTINVMDLDLLSTDLLSTDLLDNLETDQMKMESLLNRQTSSPRSPTDYDSIGEKSPSHSDSGVSLDSASPFSEEQYGLNGSPQEAVPLFSPQTLMSAASPLDMDYFNLDSVNFDTSDSSALLADSDILGPLDATGVSIDLDLPTELLETYDMNFDPSFSTVITSTAPTTKTTTIKLLRLGNGQLATLPFTVKDVKTTVQSKHPELKLTQEEQVLLSQEGHVLPTNLPLTKEEESILKGVRRKIRNKVSAKESRKRKMEYVDGLEKRVKYSTQENQQLHKKVNVLEKQNSTLIVQLKKLQALIMANTNKPAQSKTCFMVLALSFLFIMLPSAFNPFGGSGSEKGANLGQVPMPGNSRSLLHESDKMSNPDDPYGVSRWPLPPWDEPAQTAAVAASVSLEDSNNDDDMDNSAAEQDEIMSMRKRGVSPKISFMENHTNMGLTKQAIDMLETSNIRQDRSKTDL